MLLQAVKFIIFCFQSSLRSATVCCQPERQIQQDAWGFARITGVSQQCFYENYPQLIEKEQRPPSHCPNLNVMEVS